MPIRMRVNKDSSIRMNVDNAKVVYIGGEPYVGEYDIIPQTDGAVILPTNGKLMADNVTVKKIPYYETENTSGGMTVYIGSDAEIQ